LRPSDLLVSFVLAIITMCRQLCKEETMATNLALDSHLLNLALKVGGFKSKKDTVNAALKEFVERRKQLEIIDLFGQLPCDDAYNYKDGRK